MNKQELQAVASDHNLGVVSFEFRTALNTGKQFEAGYVYDESASAKRVLFCKRQSNSSENDFYLYNEFRKLEPSQKIGLK